MRFYNERKKEKLLRALLFPYPLIHCPSMCPVRSTYSLFHHSMDKSWVTQRECRWRSWAVFYDAALKDDVNFFSLLWKQSQQESKWREFKLTTVFVLCEEATCNIFTTNFQLYRGWVCDTQRTDFGWSLILKSGDNGVSSRWIDDIYVCLL